MNHKREGSVLVGLLWCIALLSVLVVGVLHTGRLDLLVAKNYGDNLQAHYLALAGVEKAKALIYHEASSRKTAQQNHSGQLTDVPAEFRDVRFGRGEFRVVHYDAAQGTLRYGISDEESRLSINHATVEELLKLPRMTPEVAAAIADWRDEDDNVTQGGAETEYYSGLQRPYIPRNGRIQTARELAAIRGVSQEYLLAEDANQNGLLDPEEDDGELTFPPDNRDGRLDAGWSGLISFESWVQNRTAAGEPRVNVQSADETELTKITGITPELAKAIVEYRGQNQIENLADLLDVSAMSRPQAQPPRGEGENAPGQPPPQAAQAQPTGPKLISEDLLLQIADEVTAQNETAHYGLVNINSASPQVLQCLPGITEELAYAIVRHRESAGYFPNTAWLLRVPGMTKEIFEQVSQRVSARSETFRILSEGRVTSSGARRRIEVIVHLGSSYFDTLSWRDNL